MKQPDTNLYKEAWDKFIAQKNPNPLVIKTFPSPEKAMQLPTTHENIQA